MEKPGLYIHVPFCRKKCHYCSFFSLSSPAMIPAFLKRLLQEMDIYAAKFQGFDTVYIGGGTPSLLSINDLSIILDSAANKFTIAPHAEITVEANPADIDLPGLMAWRNLGINRINVGIQSFDEDALKFLGRRHNSRQAIKALEAAEKAGFDNAGLDLIYGVPGQEVKSWTDTLRQALAFNPAHLSCYQLTIESNTPLGIRLAKGEIAPPNERTMADLFFKTSEIIEYAGYLHYEVSNFARSMKLQSRHNQKYWDHTPYLGLGPSAHSFDGRRRWWNYRSLTAYTDNLEKGIPPVEASEDLTDEQLRLECLFLGLRTRKGVNLQYYKLRYGKDLLSEKKETISLLVERGLIEIKYGRLRPTLAGMAVADSLALI